MYTYIYMNIALFLINYIYSLPSFKNLLPLVYTIILLRFLVHKLNYYYAS